MTTTTIAFEHRPAPVLSEDDRRLVRTWLDKAVPPLRALPFDAACEAASHVVSDMLAFGILAGRKPADIWSALLSRQKTEEAAADATAMESGESAPAKALAQAMQDILTEPGATAATAVQIFIEPLQPADQAYLLNRMRATVARLEPLYQTGMLMPFEARKFERFRKQLAEMSA